MEIILLLTFAVAFGHCAFVSFEEKELDCYSQEKVYHRETDKCYKLLTKGPCEVGKWLVLERPTKGERKSRKIRPICVAELCKEGEYYWPPTRSCIESKEKAKVCGGEEDEELTNNVFGEGECTCTREPPRARIGGDRNKPCYQLYSRGPCNTKQIVVLPPDETTKATCVDDPCHEESVRRKKNGSLSKDGVLAAYENGTCYELGTQGPCPRDMVFKVHANNLRPDCSSLTTNIFSFQKQQGCYQDENGDCQKRVTNNKRGDAERYKVELMNSYKG